MLFDPLAIFGKYDPHTNCPSGTKIDKPHCCDEKQVVHSIWLLPEVVWQCTQYEV